MNHTLRIIAIAGLAPAAAGQVVINEVWENPPGDGDIFDASLEYIEFYGEPGTDLTGFAVALIKGGSDADGDGVPVARPEIDEAFSLDGIVLGANGFAVVYNNTGGFSDIPFLIPADTSGIGFVEAHIPSIDTPGKLGNGDSSSYVLVRKRAFHSVVAGASVYDAGYAYRKDVNPDVDFDGKLDFGFEPTITGPATAMAVDPLQVIDDVAWSNGGGKEYVRSSEQEISETPGFNPDGVSRVAYYAENPMLGSRVNSEGETVPTRTADEEWIRGEQGPGDGALTYVNAESGAPTDPNGDGFQDLDITGFAMTPGDFNDAAGITQFRFTRGDFNFDGAADAQDGALIAGALGEDLDIMIPCTDADGDPVLVDGAPAMCAMLEGRAANGLMAMMNMDKADAPGGTNAPFVTQADLDAWNDEFGAQGCNDADLAGAFGLLDLADINAFVAGFVNGDPVADIDGNALFDLSDINLFVTAFTAGCP